jgi:DNA-directed RNA polymerase specialized sigma24 family protein
MTRLNAADLARNFEALFGVGTMAGLGDSQLLDRFVTRRDEAACAELIARHGPIVLRICRRSLVDPHDIEEAFQATFLILVRKAPSLRDRNALSSSLYGVSLRVVHRARAKAARHGFANSPSVPSHQSWDDPPKSPSAARSPRSWTKKSVACQRSSRSP